MYKKAKQKKGAIMKKNKRKIQASITTAPEKTTKIKETIMPLGVILFLASIYIGLKAGLVQFNNPKLDYMNATIQGLSSRDSIKLTVESIHCIFFNLVQSAFICMAAWVHMERISKDNNAQGTAHQTKDVKQYNEKFVDQEDQFNNMILTDSISLSMNSSKTRRNNNICVVGGSGSGKTRFLIKPNILQANCSFVITDPKGEILEAEGEMLKRNGYDIKVLNLTDMKHSHSYNPFEYIRDDNGVLMLINCLIQNTNNGQKGGDPFWEKSETALLEALIFYLRTADNIPDDKKNFNEVLNLLGMAEVDENNPSAKSTLDIKFEDLKKKYPNSPAVSAYKTFKLGAGKTLKSILISAAVRLQVFNLEDVSNLTMKDSLDLMHIGDRKTALFAVIPAADDTYNFIVSMMYSQLFESLYYRAANECPNEYWIKDGNEVLAIAKASKHGLNRTKKDAENLKRLLINACPAHTRAGWKLSVRSHNFERIFDTKEEVENYKARIKRSKIVKGAIRLPVPVRFLLDEFANIGTIPNFTKKLATMRSYEISCTIILQNLSQLKTMYKDDQESVIGNCDSFLFLGGQEQSTLEFVSKLLGKETVIGGGRSTSSGKSGGSMSFNQVGKELMSIDRLATMPKDKCVLVINGLHPFYCSKYQLERHPHYSESGDADEKNLYNIKQIVNYGLLKAEKASAKLDLSAIQGLNNAKPAKTFADIMRPNVASAVINLSADTTEINKNQDGTDVYDFALYDL